MPNIRLTIIQLTLFIGILVGLPHILLLPFSKQDVVAFDNRPSKVVHKNQPEVVLIGNSMLKTRVSSQVFNKNFGKRTITMPMGGSGSTRWYLLLKNSVFPATDRVRQVVIFFRDHEIIDPLFRVTNQHRYSVERMKVGKELELREVQRASQNWQEAAWEWLFEHSWVIQVHRAVRSSFTVVAIRDWFPNPARAHLKALTKSRFEIENLRTDLNFEPEVLGRAPTRDLKTAIEKSLLPKIVELTRKHKAQLVLYRVSRRPGVDEVSKDYIDALRAYSKEQGIKYIEEAELFGQLPLDWYADGDHISATVKKKYSKSFAEKLKEGLK
jgi:hypothetical protein